jgi:hypothetical protein
MNYDFCICQYGFPDFFNILGNILQALPGRRGHDRMVVGITTINAISGYHH